MRLYERRFEKVIQPYILKGTHREKLVPEERKLKNDLQLTNVYDKHFSISVSVGDHMKYIW